MGERQAVREVSKCLVFPCPKKVAWFDIKPKKSIQRFPIKDHARSINNCQTRNVFILYIYIYVCWIGWIGCMCLFHVSSLSESTFLRNGMVKVAATVVPLEWRSVDLGKAHVCQHAETHKPEYGPAILRSVELMPAGRCQVAGCRVSLLPYNLVCQSTGPFQVSSSHNFKRITTFQ